ncbi:MBL fold metallo-hydrolase [Infirmifilum lucidum]|uniref:MBL fold metallo-hydrolase n=1 Tax=Infirmifilum lucidum TaxID=2776706 RepID=A0A7L9FLS3_9CREN|nr:MBL fold metallo-hydrolase [Infirmifilum lucidum]
MRALTFRGVKISRRGLAGAILTYGGESICIDSVDPSGCSIALYTHNHPGHSPPALPGIPVYSPFAGRIVAPGERLELGKGVRLTVVHAYNISLGGAVAHPRGSGVGFLVEFPTGLRVYHAGDTDLISEMVELRGRVDLAFLPVSGQSVMNPEEAAEAVRTLRPAIAVPVHEGGISRLRVFKRLAQPYTQVVLMEGG